MSSSSSKKNSGGPLFERFNTHDQVCVEVPLFGSTWRLAQAPDTNHLGTTVWDASIVLAKWIEKNARRGSELSRPKLAGGKRVLELGAGMGLGGLSAAALGASVDLTDVAEVLPLLRRNAEALMGKAALSTNDAAWAAGAGSVSVRELDWDKRETWFDDDGAGDADGGSNNKCYDFILAADCVYKEEILPTLLRVVLAHASRRTVVVVANELRSHSVAAAFDAAFAPHFTMKRVPRSKMDAEYSVDAISIVVMKRKHAPGASPGEEDAGGVGGAEGKASGATVTATTATTPTTTTATTTTATTTTETEVEGAVAALAAGLAIKEE